MGNGLGGALSHQLAALVARTRADVDDPVALGHDAHFMFDDDDRMPSVHQAVELFEEAIDIARV